MPFNSREWKYAKSLGDEREGNNSPQEKNVVKSGSPFRRQIGERPKTVQCEYNLWENIQNYVVVV